LRLSHKSFAGAPRTQAACEEGKRDCRPVFAGRQSVVECGCSAQAALLAVFVDRRLPIVPAIRNAMPIPKTIGSESPVNGSCPIATTVVA
jgi:hypothetical protein